MFLAVDSWFGLGLVTSLPLVAARLCLPPRFARWERRLAFVTSLPLVAARLCLPPRFARWERRFGGQLTAGSRFCGITSGRQATAEECGKESPNGQNRVRMAAEYDPILGVSQATGERAARGYIGRATVSLRSGRGRADPARPRTARCRSGRPGPVSGRNGTRKYSGGRPVSIRCDRKPLVRVTKVNPESTRALSMGPSSSTAIGRPLRMTQNSGLAITSCFADRRQSLTAIGSLGRLGPST